MFYWVAKNSKFPADKWKCDQTDPYCSVALSKSNVFIHGVSAFERAYTKEKSNFHFQKCPRPLRESVRLRECVNAEFDWEVKRGFEKASVSTAVRLRECPLAGS